MVDYTPPDTFKPPHVHTSGRTVLDNAVLALIRLLADSSSTVRAAVQRSLLHIGEDHPSLVLSCCMLTVSGESGGMGADDEQKLDGRTLTAFEFRVVLLELMGLVLERLAKSDYVFDHDALVASIAAFAVHELRMDGSLRTQWQSAASSVLCSLAVLGYVEQTMEALLTALPPGRVPHPYVMKSFALIADANGVAFVPFVTDIFARLIPVINRVNEDKLRGFVAEAVGSFSMALLSFDTVAPDDLKLEISRDTFSSGMNEAFDVVFPRWLGCRDENARKTITAAVGKFGYALSLPSFEVAMPRLIQHYLSQLRKESVSLHLSIVDGLIPLLRSAVLRLPEAVVDLQRSVFPSLFPYVCSSAGDESLTQIHTDLLHCFRCIAVERDCAEGVIAFVESKLSVKEAPARCGALLILRDLVSELPNRTFANLESRIMNSVVGVCSTELSLRVRYSLLLLVLTLAEHKYWTLVEDSARSMILFVVQQCSITDQQRSTKRIMSLGDVTPSQVKALAHRTLQHCATQVPDTHRFLWPFLLHLIVPKEYGGAIDSICQALHTIVVHRQVSQVDGTYARPILDFQGARDRLPNVHELLCRLMVLACDPHSCRDGGLWILRMLLVLAPSVEAGIAEVFDTQLPPLIDDVSARCSASENVVGKEHKDLLLSERSMKNGEDEFDGADTEAHAEFVRNIDGGMMLVVRNMCMMLEHQSTRSWIQAMISILLQQYDTHLSDRPILRNAAHRIIGILGTQLASKSQITSVISSIIRQTNHFQLTEASGCAIAIGFIASTNSDLVLSQITQMASDVLSISKKTGFLFGKSKDSISQAVAMQSTLALCYAHICRSASIDQILKQIDRTIVPDILSMLQAGHTDTRGPWWYDSLGRAITLICESLHPMRLSESHASFRMTNRFELVGALLSAWNHGTLNEKLRLIGTLASVAWVRPTLTDDERQQILSLALALIQIPAHYQQEEQLVQRLLDLFAAFQQTDISIARMLAHLHKLELWMTSQVDFERRRACKLYLGVLQQYVTIISDSSPHSNAQSQNLAGLGHFICRLVPRCSDSDADTRAYALESLQTLFYLDEYLQNPHDPSPSNNIKQFNMLRNRLAAIEQVSTTQLCIVEQGSTDSSSMSAKRMSEFYAREPDLQCIARLIGALLRADQYLYLPRLMTAVHDVDRQAALGTLVVIEVLLDELGESLLDIAQAFVTAILNTMRCVKWKNISARITSSLVHLARHQLRPVLECLLQQQIPVSSEVVLAFQALARDRHLSETLLVLLLDVINTQPTITKSPSSLSIGEVKPSVVACNAIREICVDEATRPLIDRYFAIFFATFTCNIGAGHMMNDDAIVRESVSALRTAMLLSPTYRAADDASDRATIYDLILSSHKYERGVIELFSHIVNVQRDVCDELALILIQSPFNRCAGSRSVSTACLGAIVYHVVNDVRCRYNGDSINVPKVNQVVDAILERIQDVSPRVCVQALCALRCVPSELRANCAKRVLQCLSRDDDDDDALQVDQNAFETLLILVSDSQGDNQFNSIVLDILGAARLGLDHENAYARSHAFSLFGVTCRFAHVDPVSVEREVHASFASYAVRIGDEESDGVCSSSARKSLVALARLIGVQSLIECAERILDQVIVYESFLSSLCDVLHIHFGAMLDDYLSCARQYLRSTRMESNLSAYATEAIDVRDLRIDEFNVSSIAGNAAMFAAQLAVVRGGSTQFFDELTIEIVRLLDCPKPQVRCGAAIALSFIESAMLPDN